MNHPLSSDNFSDRPRPVLKWAGAKSWILPYLEPLWHRHLFKKPEARLVEPFAGSLAVSVGIDPPDALLNDFNYSLINFYKWVKTGLKAPITPVNSEFVYYDYRRLFNELIRGEEVNSKAAAYLFYYLNRTCYRGLCRFNQRGEFNTPYGAYPQLTYIEDFNEFRKVISRWKFESRDFSNLIIRGDDFVYADPPYDTEFKHFTKDVFSWSDQQRVAEWLNKLANQGIAVATSNEATPRILKLYKSMNFKLNKLSAPRKIGNGKRIHAIELFATRNI